MPLAMDIFPMKKLTNIQIFLCMDESKTMLDVQWQTQVIECRLFLQQVSLHLMKFYTAGSTVNVQIIKYGINYNIAFRGEIDDAILVSGALRCIASVSRHTHFALLLKLSLFTFTLKFLTLLHSQGTIDRYL